MRTDNPAVYRDDRNVEVTATHLKTPVWLILKNRKVPMTLRALLEATGSVKMHEEAMVSALEELVFLGVVKSTKNGWAVK